MGYPRVNRANKYVRDVLAGRVVACDLVRRAAQRHADDLKRDFDYVFDKGLAERACMFIEAMPHTKGRWAQKRETIELQPWQCFLVASIFGWVHRDTRRRRFREAYIEVPRKSGKSIIAAAIGLYMFVGDGEYGAEVYAGATSERQAWEVFRPARQMVQRTQEMRRGFGIDVNAKTMVKSEDLSRFEPVIGNPGDGASPSCAIIDEFHEHQNSNLYDTMVTGMGARDEPLVLIITTAGSDVGGPCYQKRTECRQLLEGVHDDDRTFALIYTLDDGDDWTSDEALMKANPNYGVSVSAEFLRMQIDRAKLSPVKQSAIKTKHLNVWVGAREAWLNMETWRRAADESLKREDFADCPSVLAIDLASKIDVAALAHVFCRTVGGKQHFYIFPTFYLPEDALSAAKNAQRYLGWSNAGCLNLLDGEEIDFGRVQEDIIELTHTYRIDEVIYDPWQATQLAQNLAADGANTVEFRNIVSNMSPAMKELEAALMSGRLHHDGNPAMTWMASNVVAKPDAKDNIFPRKEVSESKIDGIVAAIMAIGRAVYAEDSGHAYSERGFIQL